MIKTKEEAHDMIADAIYWLSGFSAGTTDEELRTKTEAMAINLGSVQGYIMHDLKPSSNPNEEGLSREEWELIRSIRRLSQPGDTLPNELTFRHRLGRVTCRLSVDTSSD